MALALRAVQVLPREPGAPGSPLWQPLARLARGVLQPVLRALRHITPCRAALPKIATTVALPLAAAAPSPASAARVAAALRASLCIAAVCTRQGIRD